MSNEAQRLKLETIISGHRINEDDADWLRALAHQATQPADGGCTRSHPHEDMPASCQIKAVIAEMESMEARGAEATEHKLGEFALQLRQALAPTAGGEPAADVVAALERLVRWARNIVGRTECTGDHPISWAEKALATHAKAPAPQEAAEQPVLNALVVGWPDTDRKVVRAPDGLLLAIQRAGFAVLKTQYGWELRKLGPVAAQQVEPATSSQDSREREALAPEDWVQWHEMPWQPKPIGFASSVDIMAYAPMLKLGPHLPGVRDVAMFTNDQVKCAVSNALATKAPEMPARAPLSEAEIDELAAYEADYDRKNACYTFNADRDCRYNIYRFARAIEAAHGIPSTPEGA